MLEAFEQVAQEITYSTPQISIISNLTGSLVTEEIATPEYWCAHILQPVNFAVSMKTLGEQNYQVMVEVGPKPILLGMGRYCLPEGEKVWLPSLRPGQQDWQQLLDSLAKLYLLGVTVDWSGFDRDYIRRKVVFPTYTFQRQRYWVETDNQPQKTKLLSKNELFHPLLSRRLHLAGLEQQIRFESQLSVESPTYLTDHRVFGKPVLPASAYLEMVLAIGASVFQSDRLLLEDVIIQQALVFSEDKDKTIQVILTSSDTKTYAFQVLSLSIDKAEKNPSWTLHVSGKLLQEDDENNIRLGDSSTLPDLYNEQISVEDYYQQLNKRGINYGPNFQAIRKLWRSEEKALGLIELSPDTTVEVGKYKLHPALLDACFQVMYFELFDSSNHSDIYLPVEIKRLRLHRRASSALWSQVQLCSDTSFNQPILAMDLCLFDEDKSVVVQIEGFSSKRTNRKALLNILQKQLKEEIQDCLYQVEWQPKLPKTTFEKIQNLELSHWLILADSTGVGQELATHLQRQGHHCTLVYNGDAYQNSETGIYHLNPSHPSDFERLYQEAVKSSSLPLKRIIHLWSLEAVPSEKLTIQALEQAQRQGCGSVLHLLQTIFKQDLSASPRLWLVTRGAQPVESDGGSLAVAQAPIWGLGRVVSLEHPQLWGAMVDLDPKAPENEVEMLLKQIENDREEDHLAFRQGKSYVARLVRQPLIKSESLSLRSDSTYLITGGTGALGLQVAQWMVEQGVRHLVLTGRREVSSQAQIAIARMQQIGAKIITAQADVSCQEDMVGLFEQIQTSLPPLKGIIHAAGVLELQSIEEMELKQFEAVLRPKVIGAWILHQLTQEMELDFFVNFSSIAAVWGAKDQGHYAAANHFLDGLAYYRQRQKLPCLSVNWGPWAGGGMTSEEARTWLAQMGVQAIQPDSGVITLGHLIGTSSIQTTVADVNWTLFKELYEASVDRSLLKNIQTQQIKINEQFTRQGSGILQRLQTIPDSERQHVLVTYLQNEVAKILGLSTSELNLQKPLNTMGLDSLMAVELRNLIKTELDVDVPVVKFMEGISVASLEREISEQFKDPQSTSHTPIRTRLQAKQNQQKASAIDIDKQIKPEKAGQILAKLDQLTEEEVDILLNSISEEEGNS